MSNKKFKDDNIYKIRRVLVGLGLILIIFVLYKVIAGIILMFRPEDKNVVSADSGNVIVNDQEIDFYENPIQEVVFEKTKKIYKDASKREDYYNKAVDLRANAMGRADQQSKDEKVVYLTFDDGPSSKITPQILDVLKKYDVKATFFVIGELAEKNPEYIKRIHNEGHAIANHTYSHDYDYIYSGVDHMLDDINKSDELIEEILGEEFVGKIFRFPGGSFGEKKEPYREALDDLNYIYFDWNSVNGDAEGQKISASKLVSRFNDTTGAYNTIIALMHDSNTKQTTVEALPTIIEGLQAKGYEFKTLGEV